MSIRINRVGALLLRGLLFPIVLVRRLAGPKKPAYVGTVAGDPLEYAGDRPLLIAVWADWASVWTAATADVVEQLRAEFAGRCEFAYVEASSRAVTDRYRADVVPVLILRHRGADVGRFVNTMRGDDVRRAIAAIMAQPPDAPTA